MPLTSPTILAAPDAGLKAARDGAVVCDLSPLSLLAVTGADAATFLQGQISADVVGLQPGAARFASLNSPKGRVLANFILWRDPARADRFLVLLPADIALGVAKRLSMYILRAKAAVSDESDAWLRLGVGGPAGADALRAAWGGAPAVFQQVVHDSANVIGLPGPRYVVIAPSASAEAVRSALASHAIPAAFDAWQWLAIRAGIPVITAATQELFVAQTMNWDLLGGIDFQKGCYTGQEIIARMQYLGRLKERAFLFHVEGTRVRPADRLFSAAFGEQACGTVVNAADGPDGGQDLIAVLQLAALEHGDVRVGAADGAPLTPLAMPYPMPEAGAPRGRRA